MEKVYDSILNGAFRVLADLIGVGQDAVGASAPVIPLEFMYGGGWSSDDGRTIDLDLVKRWTEAKSQSMHNDLLCIDLEGPVVPGHTSWSKDPTQWVAAEAAFSSIAAAVRAVNPELKLGWFNFPCVESRHVNGFHAKQDAYRYADYRNMTAQLESRVRFAETLDWLAPSLYWDWWHWRDGLLRNLWEFRDAFGQPSSLHRAQLTPMAVWASVATHALQLFRGFIAEKPLIPILGVQWWTDRRGLYDSPVPGELVFDSWVRRSLDLVKPHCSSLALWIDPAPAGFAKPAQYIETRSWSQIVRWAQAL